MILQVRLPPGSRYPYETPILAFRSSELPCSFLLDLTRKVGETALQSTEPMLYDLFSTATELAQSLLPKYLNLRDDMVIGVDDPHMNQLSDLEPEHGSKFFDEIDTSKTNNSSDSHGDESVNNPINQSRVYIPPGLRKPQDIQGDQLSISQVDDTVKVVMRNSRPSGRTRMKFRDRYEQHVSGGEEYKLGLTDIRVESERLKDEWDVWQKSRRDSELRGVRARLPAYKFRSELLQAINSSFVTIVCGQTGCGKSTQVVRLFFISRWCFYWNLESHPGS